MSSPEPRELASPVQLGKDFRAVVDRDFSTRVIPVGDVEVEQVAAPKALGPSTSSVTAPADSQTSGTSSEETDGLIPPPEDLTVPAEPGPSQLPHEEESLQGSTSKTSPGVPLPPAVTPPTPTSSSPNVAG